MFHEVGFHSFSGFYKSNSYKYVISKNEFKSLIKLTKYLSQTTNTVFKFTFDDGGISNIYSAEVLDEFGIKGIFFIPTNYINSIGFMTKNDIKEINANGHQIGTHTHNHPFFLNKYTYKEQFAEWHNSIEILENLLMDKIYVASAPNGFFNDSTFSILYNKNIKILYTSKPTIYTDNPFNDFNVIGRMAIKRNSNNQLLLTNNTYTYRKNLIRYNTLKLVKKILPFLW